VNDPTSMKDSLYCVSIPESKSNKSFISKTLFSYNCDDYEINWV